MLAHSTRCHSVLLSCLLGHVFLLIFSAQLIKWYPREVPLQMDFGLLECLFLVFLMHPLTINSEPLRAFQPLRVIFHFRILRMESHLVFLWIFVDCFSEVEQCLVFPSFTVTNFKITRTDTNLLPFMTKTAFEEAGFPVVLSTLWVTPQPIGM